MAWLNFINLTISRTKNRFKEIAARKVSGAVLRDVFIQFICYSCVANVLAALIGITLTQLSRVPFGQFLEIQVISLRDVDGQTPVFFLSLFVFGIIATSIYPAWATMRYTTQKMLNLKLTSGRRFTTAFFTTAQYAAALALVAWIFIMNAQLNFIIGKELGLTSKGVVVVDGPLVGLENNGLQRVNQFVKQLRAKIGEDRFALSRKVNGEIPGDVVLRRKGSEAWYGFDSHGGVDEQFIPLYGLRVIAGRNFNAEEKGYAIIISRMATERLGFKSPDAAIGSILEVEVKEEWQPIEVIGVIEDYRTRPYLMQEGSSESVTGRGECLTYLDAIGPATIPQRISVKLDAASVEGTIGEIEKIYNQEFPGNVFRWYFLDDNVGKQYGDQKIARNQLIFFTSLAVMVACLGFLGMISNKVAEKFKEISIRRILGANHRAVISVLLRSTGMQFGIALAVGLPIAWRFSQQYLEKFTDRISIQWWHFAAPTAILIIIMLTTIGGVLWKAARSNPVEALKYE
jgi:putative ABC transport system permease protein